MVDKLPDFLHGKSNLTKSNQEVKKIIDPRWGEVLRQMRENRGLSQRDVAKLIGYTHVEIHAWEVSKVPISQPILYLLLEIYQYSFLEFVAWLEKIPRQK